MSEPTQKHFIEQIIDEHIAAGTWGKPGDPTVVKTRFPPEPNGFLHIGHAKAICLSFGLAQKYGGGCNLRFDDTNPAKEEDRYVRSIIDNVRWLGFTWDGASDSPDLVARASRPCSPSSPSSGPIDDTGVKYASDYFEQMYEHARELIRAGKAYVCELTPQQINETRGSLKRPGTPSPFRDRPIDENLDLFERMKNGHFDTGTRVLRAKIDMASPNLNLRDPVMYRVSNAPHHRTGSAWHIYPMYDWAHGIEDSIEGITHSLCTLEFENHRPLYNWFIDAINDARKAEGKDPIHHSQQIEFSRLNLNFTVMSKRKLLQLVEEGHVSGWDDPRMPTISGLRRRGYTPESIRAFCTDVGITKRESVIDMGRLEEAIRDDLNETAPRRMAVLDPLKLVITNWANEEDREGGRIEQMDAVNNPEDDTAGTRKVGFGKVIYIEREDFMEDPPKKFFRLSPGKEVRLRYAYWIKCEEVIKDDAGQIVELRCTYDPQTRGRGPPDGRKVKATLHWVSESDSFEAQVRVFDRLFEVENPNKTGKDQDITDVLNPNSLQVRTGCKLESSLQRAEIGDRFQFERLGYFCVDPDSTSQGTGLIFNRTATLKDTWAKQARKG